MTFFVVGIVVLIGGTVWYVWYFNQKSTAPSVKPFSEQDQFIPKGATPQSVALGFQKLNFSKPLPFFDEKNVVQSLDLGFNAPASTTDFSVSNTLKIQPRTNAPPAPSQNSNFMFLSYRIFGQSKEAIRSALIEYFKNMGWTKMNTKDNQSLTFSSGARQVVSIVLLDAPQTVDQPTFVAALSVYRLR